MRLFGDWIGDWIPDPTAKIKTDLEIPVVFADYIASTSSINFNKMRSVNRPDYGYGRYGLGAGIKVTASLGKLKTVLLDEKVRTGYPASVISPWSPDQDEEETESNPLRTWCSKNGSKATYEDDYIRIECKQEFKECPLNRTGNVTEYYGHITFKDGIMRLEYDFTDNLLSDLIGPQIDDFEMRLVKRQVESNGCAVENPFETVGEATRQSGADHWRWSWNKDKEASGVYTITAFTKPRYFLNLPLHFHAYRDIDLYQESPGTFFTVRIGSGCKKVEEDDAWHLVDIESSCRSSTKSRFHSRHRKPGMSDGVVKRYPPGSVPWPDGAEAEADGDPPLAVSWGDPHIRTIDGASYTSLHMGEFIYIRDRRPRSNISGRFTTSGHPQQNGPLEVQVRQSQLPGFPDWASFNTAAAVRAGGHIFEVRPAEDTKFGDKLILLIDGQVTDLPPGTYQLGDAIFEIKSNYALVVWLRDPDITDPQNDPYGGYTRVRISPTTDDDLLREMDIGLLDEPAVSLRVEFSSPPTDRYHGLLGSNDGNSETDIRDPEGKRVGSLNAFVESWRINPADSLFTYTDGESADTFNLEQTAAAPTIEFLAGANDTGHNYIQQATDFLIQSCSASIDAVDPRFTASVALELAAGRTERNLIASGLCYDRNVENANRPDVSLIGMRFDGTVHLADQPAIPVTGARIVIRAREAGNLVLCDTTSFDNGQYSCGRSNYAEDYAGRTSVTLDYEITGRGEPVTLSRQVTLPVPGTTLATQQDLALSPRNVLHLTGLLSGPDTQPLAHGRVRITGAGSVEVEADANGFYQAYLALPDSMVTGQLRYEATDAAFQTYTTSERVFNLTTDGIHPINQDLQVQFGQGPAIYPQEQRTLVFTGKVKNDFVDDENVR